MDCLSGSACCGEFGTRGGRRCFRSVGGVLCADSYVATHIATGALFGEQIAIVVRFDCACVPGSRWRGC